MLDILIDAFVDTLKLIPFLFITYLIMEYIENKTSDKSKEKIKKAGKMGPLFGGILGVVPQCRIFSIKYQPICRRANNNRNSNGCIPINIR